MATPRSIGIFWWEWLTNCHEEGLPLVFRGRGLEKTHPWRFGPAFVLRIPWTRYGMAVGYWQDKAVVEHDEDGPLLSFRVLDGEERRSAMEPD